MPTEIRSRVAMAAAVSLLATACGTPREPVATTSPAAPAAPVVTAAVAPAGKTRVQWLGQSTTKITTPGGKVIVIDPWLTANPKTPEGYKRIESLGKVDLILVSHAHLDHFADAPALAKLNNVPVYGPNGLNLSMSALGILPPALSQRFNKGGTMTPIGPGIKIIGTHAEHSSELVWRNPATGQEEIHVGGEPMGFIIELENGFKIYHAGDTGLFGDMRLIGEYYRPDLILIPIGGHFVMDPRDAAVATRQFLKPKYAIPIHYGTTPELKGTPEEYMKALGTGSAMVLPIKPGEAVDF